MADNIMVFSVPDDAIAKVAGIGHIFGSPEADAERVPVVDIQVIIAKVLNNAQQFKIEDDKQDYFNGVLLHFNATRSWWEKSMDEGSGGNAPDCHSVDGVKPLANSPKKQSDLCNSCPRNRFVTDDKGKKRKPCSDKIELFFYNPRYDLPVLIRASTMNRKPIVDFIEKCAEIGVRKEMLVVKLSLFETRNKGGVKYDALRIDVIGTVQTLADFKNREEKTTKHTADSIAAAVLEFKNEHEEVFGTYVSDVEPTVEVAPEAEAKPEAESTGAANANNEVNSQAAGYNPPF